MENLKGFSNYVNDQLDLIHLEAIKRNMYSIGIESLQLAEVFGSKIADFIKEKFENLPIFLACGVGERSGYGLVIARYLSNLFETHVIFPNDKVKINDYVAKHNYYITKNLQSIYHESTLPENIKKGIIIDAICDYNDEPSPELIELAKQVNKIKRTNNKNIKVFSIEYPSFINNNTYPSIKPDYIFSLYKGIKEINKSNVINIALDLPIEARLLTGMGDLYLATRKKQFNDNKYSSGSLLILGGGEKYHGAPISASFSAFNTIAALRTALGYVTVALPDDVVKIARSFSTNIIVESFGKKFDGSSIDKITKIRHDTIVVGPGMDQTDETLEALNKLIELEIKNNKKIIIDATALNFYKNLKTNKTNYKNIIITPHEGEFERLISKPFINLSFEKKVRVAIDFADKNKCTLVLKGAKTIITNGKLLKISIPKTPALATMGTGDVLDGIIAAYFTVNKDPFESATAGVYLHAQIGDKLFNEKGTHIIAEDIVNEIPIFLKHLDL